MRQVSVIAIAAVAAVANTSPAKSAFSVAGKYVEGCSCGSPCKCELTGVEMGCQGIGAFQFDKGSFNGATFDGARAAYAVAPGSWVVVYVDAKDAKSRAAAGAFMKTMLAGFGKVESVKDAKIAIVNKGGSYKVSVDGGKVMTFSSEPVLGGDGKTPLVYSNIHDPVHPTIMQGKTKSLSYHDGSHKFDLKDSNAFFFNSIKASGKL